MLKYQKTQKIKILNPNIILKKNKGLYPETEFFPFFSFFLKN